jgi:nitroreductase
VTPLGQPQDFPWFNFFQNTVLGLDRCESSSGRRMMDILEVIFSRRSIRKYQERKVERETLVQLLQAGMAAPTAANAQPWEFVVVDEPEGLENLRGCLPFGQYNNPAAIVVCGNPDIANNSVGKMYWVQDCSAAIENILIAAAGMGLGGVWIGIYPVESRVEAVRKALNMPAGVTPLGAVYLGVPAEQKEARTQYDEHRVHWQIYEERKRRARLKNAKHQE